jgi:hypothetical protein
MKTTDGYEVCIKADEVKCVILKPSVLGNCSAFGRIQSLTGGEARHWSTKQERGQDFIPCADFMQQTFTCSAAKVFAKY